MNSRFKVIVIYRRQYNYIGEQGKIHDFKKRVCDFIKAVLFSV